MSSYTPIGAPNSFIAQLLHFYHTKKQLIFLITGCTVVFLIMHQIFIVDEVESQFATQVRTARQAKQITDSSYTHPHSFEESEDDGSLASKDIVVLQCEELFEHGQVVALTAKQRTLWKRLDCANKLSDIEDETITSSSPHNSKHSVSEQHNAEHKHTEEGESSNLENPLHESIVVLRDKASHSKGPTSDSHIQLHGHRHEAVDNTKTAQCLELQKQYKVVIGSSWGSLPRDLQKQWTLDRCDAAISLGTIEEYMKQHPEDDQPVPVPESRQKPTHIPINASLKPIAICVCTTTRTLKITSLTDLSLFSKLLPSFVRTAERGFEYWIYIAYDGGDLFFDRADTVKTVEEWFQTNVAVPLKAREIDAALVLNVFDNVQHKPGPVFNYVTHLAYIDGANYIYRINDDTEFVEVWSKAFVDQIEQLGAPYGVIGPRCDAGNTGILTHDFTHRLHHEIFPRHYPNSLSDWWMDDWISRVYGRKRTIKMQHISVGHLTGSHGTRYSVDTSHGSLVEGEIERGRRTIEKWLQEQKDEQFKQILVSYQQDEFAFHTR